MGPTDDPAHTIVIAQQNSGSSCNSSLVLPLPFATGTDEEVNTRSGQKHLKALDVDQLLTQE